jgi:hypothetical protein
VIRSEGLALGALIVAALALRLSFVLVVPPFQAPDEAAHFHYVETVARTGRLPIAPPRSAAMFVDERAQSYQPPLAYVLLAGAAPEAWRSVRVVRLGNAVAGAATVAVGYLVAARLTAAGDVRRLLVGILLAFFPGFAANAAAVNNDTLANLLAAVLWLPLLAPLGPAAACAAGAVLGAACLAKLSTAALAPLVLVAPLCRDPRHPKRALALAAGATPVAAAMMVPWLARNHQLYGDPLAIGVGSMSFEWLASLLPAEAVRELATPAPARVFWQFWGCFGVYNNLHWVGIPAVVSPLFGLGLAGWLRPGGADDVRFRRAAVAGAAAVALAAAGVTWFSFRYHAAWQGRYLYPAMLPVALLVAGGWHHLLPARTQRTAAALIALALSLLDVAVLARLHAFFTTTPPARWPFALAL